MKRIKNYLCRIFLNLVVFLFFFGFIAQDVQKIFPEFVDVKDDGYLGISYTNFSVVAVKAIQEQQDEIEALKKHDELLQKQIDKLQKQIELRSRNK